MLSRRYMYCIFVKCLVLFDLLYLCKYLGRQGRDLKPYSVNVDIHHFYFWIWDIDPIYFWIWDIQEFCDMGYLNLFYDTSLINFGIRDIFDGLFCDMGYCLPPFPPKPSLKYVGDPRSNGNTPVF